MSKKVFVIGSLSQESEIMRLFDLYTSLDFEADYAHIDDLPFEVLNKIKDMDLVVAVPEKNGTFCSESLGRMVFASRYGKPVIISIYVGGDIDEKQQS